MSANEGKETHDDTPEIEDAVPASRALHFWLQLGVHSVAFIVFVSLWAALDTWAIVSQLPVASFFAVLGSLLFGFLLANVLHEWSHFLGARFGGALYTFKSRPAPLFFDFDLENNSAKQFLGMSIGGSLGNVLLIVLVYLFVPLDTVHRDMLFAATVAALVLVAVLEWPVIYAVANGTEPKQAVAARFTQAGVFKQAILAAFASALLLWLAL